MYEKNFHIDIILFFENKNKKKGDKDKSPFCFYHNKYGIICITSNSGEDK